MATGLILFAHGSRDARWAEPFERVLARVRAIAPNSEPVLAYLERMTPDLATAIGMQAARGFTRIRVVPLFLGYGGHLRHDVPALVARIGASHPGLVVEIAAPAGEDADVIDVLAAYAARVGAK